MSGHRDEGYIDKSADKPNRAGGAKAFPLNSRQMDNSKIGCNEHERHSERKKDRFPPSNGETVPIHTDVAACPVLADIHGHYLGDESHRTG